MKITIETTSDARMFSVQIGDTCKGAHDLPAVLRIVAGAAAYETLRAGAVQTEDLAAVGQFKAWRTAMDALDTATSEVEAGLEAAANAVEDAYENSTELEKELAADEVKARVDQSPLLQRGMEHASAAYAAYQLSVRTGRPIVARGVSPAYALALGQIAAGVAAALHALGDEHGPEKLRDMYDEAEPLISVLLAKPLPPTDTGGVVTAPGGDA